jgi:hypothetical protein
MVPLRIFLCIEELDVVVQLTLQILVGLLMRSLLLHWRLISLDETLNLRLQLFVDILNAFVVANETTFLLPLGLQLTHQIVKSLALICVMTLKLSTKSPDDLHSFFGTLF